MKKLMAKLERLLAAGGIKKDGALLALSGAAVICSLRGFRPFPFDMARIAIILCGVPIILEAVIGLVTAFDIKADVLVSLALIASICIGEDFAAGEVTFIMQLGGLLEELTVARAGIEKLMHLTPQTARVLHGEGEEIIPAEQVRVGDRIRVLPGEGVPVDGVIVSGQTSINQAVMTGESLPVDKTVGDSVSSGTVNQLGIFEMEATKVGEDSSIQRMIRLVQSADADAARPGLIFQRVFNQAGNRPQQRLRVPGYKDVILHVGFQRHAAIIGHGLHLQRGLGDCGGKIHRLPLG